MRFLEMLGSLWDQISTILLSFRIPDLLDICLVAFILYSAIKLIRETRAMQLAKGLVLLGIGYLIISALNMQTSIFIFQKLLSNFIIVVVIVFQQEIRHALESVGGSSLKSFSILSGTKNDNIKRDEATKEAINAVCKAGSDLSQKKIGAIIAFEKGTLLGEVINTGTLVDANVTKELIGNIFFPMSPLHDGAVIIRYGRIYAAGCILPLTQNNNISRELGTRHRAALGLSEQSDAIVVVISEESGSISVALKGELSRNISEEELFEKLISYLLYTETQNDKEIGRIRKIFGGKRNE